MMIAEIELLYYWELEHARRRVLHPRFAAAILVAILLRDRAYCLFRLLAESY
jgi:hypothetical protein